MSSPNSQKGASSYSADAPPPSYESACDEGNSTDQKCDHRRPTISQAKRWWRELTTLFTSEKRPKKSFVSKVEEVQRNEEALYTCGFASKPPCEPLYNALLETAAAVDALDAANDRLDSTLKAAARGEIPGAAESSWIIPAGEDGMCDPYHYGTRSKATLLGLLKGTEEDD